MDKIKDMPTRKEISEKVESASKDMENIKEDMEEIAEDMKTLRHTIENLNFSGTADGVDQVEKIMDSAENTTEDCFDQEDDKMEEIQNDSQEYQEDLSEKQGLAENDLGKISDASMQIKRKEVTDQMTDAKDSTSQDIDFMKEKTSHIDQDLNQSKSVQERLRDIVKSGKRG